MAYEFPGVIASFKSSGNLSSKQYCLVQPTTCTDNSVKLATGVTNKLLGIVQNTPSTGGNDGVSVMLTGISKARKDSTGAAVTKGDVLTVTTGGGVKKSTGGATTFRRAIALETMAAASTGFISVQLMDMGPGSTSV